MGSYFLSPDQIRSEFWSAVPAAVPRSSVAVGIGRPLRGPSEANWTDARCFGLADIESSTTRPSLDATADEAGRNAQVLSRQEVVLLEPVPVFGQHLHHLALRSPLRSGGFFMHQLNIAHTRTPLGHASKTSGKGQRRESSTPGRHRGPRKRS